MNKRQYLSVANRLHWGALQIAGLYLLIGGLWILFSDRVADRIALNQEMLTTISLYKGWGYVLITALLLYWLIRRHTAALHESRVQLQRVMDALPMFISYVDTNRRYQFTNHTYKEWFDEHVEGKHVEEVLGEATYKTASKYIDKVLSGETTSYEVEIIHQGSERFINTTYIPDIGVNGQVKGFFVMGLDRTAEKQSEEALRLWANAFEGCAHGIAIGDPHTNRIMVCNPAFARLHKCRVEDIEGSAILSLYAPSDHEQVRRNVQRADQIGSASFEARMIRKDGSIFPVQMDIVSVLGEDGELLHRVATAQDISERKAIDEKLKASETKYRTLVEHLPAITYISDPDQYVGVTYISPQIETLGFDVDTWLDDPELWFQQIHPDDQERVIAELQRFEAGAESFKAEYRLLLPDGEVRWFHDESIRVKDQGGKTIFKQGFMLDITEGKQAEEKLLMQARWLEQINDAVITSNTDLVITGWNPAAERVYGWKAEEVIGRTGEEVLRSEFFSKTRVEVLQELRDTGQFSAEITQLKKDGSRIQIETRTVALRDESSHGTGYLSINRDITERKKAEEENKSLARFPEENPNPVLRATHEGKIIYANAASQPLLNDWHAQVGDDLPAEWIQVVKELTHTGSGKTMDVQCGETTYSIMIVYAPDANDVNIYGRDITERKQAEEYLRRFELLSEHSRDIILFMRRDDGRILEANAAALRAYGYSRDELLAFTVHDLRDSETIGLTSEQMAQADAGGVLFETIHKRKDGSTFPVEVSSQGAAIGGVRTLISIVRDITERKQAEQALQQSEENFSKAFQSSPAALLITRLSDGRFMELNDAYSEVVGYDRTELLGHLTIDLDIYINSTDRQAIVKQLLAKGSIRNFETSIRHRSGEIRYVVAAQELITFNGEACVLTHLLDITERKRAEKLIEQSNQKLNEILDSIQDDFYVLDRDWNFVYASRQFTSKVGKEPEDFVGNNIWMMFPKHVGTVLEDNFRAAMERRETRRFEIGGKYTNAWYRMTAFPSAEGITVLGVDITQLKQAEDALELKDRLLHLTSEMAKVGGWEFDAATGKGMWTDEVARIHDLDPAQETNVEMGLDFYEGESREKIERAVQEAVERAKPYDLELEMVTAKGNRKWVRTMGLPILQDDRVTKVQGIFQDITERKQIEKALQTAHDELERKVQERTAALSEANALLQALMDNLPDQIYFKDRQSHFIRNSRSQAALLGLSDPTEAVGKTDFDFFPHASRSYAEEQEVMNSGKPIVDLEEWVVWPDGREMWVLTTKLPLRDPKGNTIGIFGISHDITERKQAEQAIRQLNTDLEKQAEKLKVANKELEAFSYSVSHDLRAPLRAIDGYTRILLEDYEPLLDAEGKRVCGVISREARRMGQLIDDLLAFSRLGRKEMYTSKIDMRAQAVSVLNDLIKEEDRKRIDFHIGKLPSIQGDSSLIRQVWVNLLSNALKFTSKREKAVIEVGSKQGKEETIYYVRDTGAGFEMEYANKLFGVFQRLHGESEFDGTGVGLAIVQRVIHRHGGRVWAEGEVDKGATFYFALPRKESDHE